MKVAEYHRVRKGVPAGGQFAAAQRPESDLVSSDTLLDTDRRDEAPNRLRRIRDVRATSAFEAEILEQATRSAAYLVANRRGREATDELAQDVLVAVVARMGRGESSDIRSLRAFIHTTARHTLASRESQRSEVRSASAIWRSECADLEQRTGRHLTITEQDEIAESIRMAQPPGRRAPEGFHRRPVVGSLDADPAVMGKVAVAEAEPRDFALGSLGDRAEETIAAGGRAGTWAARNIAWDALADGAGAPHTVRALSIATASRDRKAMSAAGGARAVARRWNAGQSSPEEDAMLFRPFGGDALDGTGREAVVGILLRAGQHTDQLWDAAVAAATDRKPSSASRAGGSR